MSVPTLAALRAQAAGLGFLACGVAGLEPSRHAVALERWLAAGYAGTMRYLHRQAAKRKAPARIVPGARIAVVVLENYLPRAQSGVRRRSVKLARYARGTDYHRVFRQRLEQLAQWLRANGATIAAPYTDAGPVPERELAQRAGLGWIGKNTMLIRPESGSFVFIGVVFTDLALQPEDAADTDRCGSCTRCLDACPTQAFVAPRVLDATRCISFHTIESRRPIPEAIVAKLDGWGFGCDICNEVCPWNVRFAQPSPRDEYQERGGTEADDPEYFARLSEAQFAARFGDTPLERAGLAGMRRNWTAAFKSLESA